MNCIAILTISNAQVTNVDLNKTCFCCGNFYNLVKPIITGNPKVNCGTSASFSIAPCPTATITWSVSPSVPFSGQGTTTITFPPTTPVGNHSIHVTLSCNGKTIEANDIKFSVVGPQTCDPSFTFIYSLLPNGNINVTTTPAASTQVAGTEHWWGIQINGTYPNCNNPCTAIPFNQFTNTGVWGGYINGAGVLTPYMGTGITKGPSGYGMSYDGVGKPNCIKITHYVKCCGVLYRQTQCASFSQATNAKAIKPEVKTEVGQVELVKPTQEIIQLLKQKNSPLGDMEKAMQ